MGPSLALRRHAEGFLGAILLFWVTLGSPAIAQVTADPSYRLGPDDRVRVSVAEDEALNLDRQVARAGTINLPLVGDVAVAGLTTQEVQARIKRALERDYLRLATVDVTVTDARSQPITILGAVQNPGTIYLGGSWRLSQVISAAGGIVEGHKGIIEIRRQSTNGLADRLEVDLVAVVQQRDDTVDIPVLARDVVSVPVASDITVYFLGEVSTQGAVTLKGTERASLLTAIARAGGLTDRAASRVTIRRSRDDGSSTEIVANFRKILAGSVPDVPLEDGDLIVVKEAFL